MSDKKIYITVLCIHCNEPLHKEVETFNSLIEVFVDTTHQCKKEYITVH